MDNHGCENYIELVEKTLRVLESLSESEPGIALGELAARVGGEEFPVSHSLHAKQARLRGESEP